jgi:hypothetical protein
LAEFERPAWLFVFQCLEAETRKESDSAFLAAQRVALAAVEKVNMGEAVSITGNAATTAVATTASKEGTSAEAGPAPTAGPSSKSRERIIIGSRPQLGATLQNPGFSQQPASESRAPESNRPDPMAMNMAVPLKVKTTVPKAPKTPVPRKQHTQIPRAPKTQVPRVSEKSVPRVSVKSVPRVIVKSVPRVSEQSVPRMSEKSVPTTTGDNMDVDSDGGGEVSGVQDRKRKRGAEKKTRYTEHEYSDDEDDDLVTHKRAKNKHRIFGNGRLYSPGCVRCEQVGEACEQQAKPAWACVRCGQKKVGCDRGQSGGKRRNAPHSSAPRSRKRSQPKPKKVSPDSSEGDMSYSDSESLVPTKRKGDKGKAKGEHMLSWEVQN